MGRIVYKYFCIPISLNSKQVEGSPGEKRQPTLLKRFLMVRCDPVAMMAFRMHKFAVCRLPYPPNKRITATKTDAITAEIIKELKNSVKTLQKLVTTTLATFISHLLLLFLCVGSKGKLAY